MHVNTNSDSNFFLIFWLTISITFLQRSLDHKDIFYAVRKTHRMFVVLTPVAMIIGHGMVAFRDRFGIRALVFGNRSGKTDYMFASETVALDIGRFRVCA